MGADVRRAGDHALLLLGAAVVVACLGLGAPPRMEAIETGPAWVRIVLESLLPLAVVQVLTLLAAARLAAAGALLGPPGAPLPFVALAALAGLGALQWALGWTLWDYGTGVALVQVIGLLVAGAAVTASLSGEDRGVRVRRVVAFVALVAAAECAYGLATTHLGDDTVLGFAKVSSNGRVTGTFVMPSILGALGAVGACAAVGLALAALRARRVAVAAAWVLVVAVCCAGAVLTLSRWMVAATATGLVVTAWVAGGALRRDGRTGAGLALRGVAVLVPAAGVAAALLVPALRERFELLLPYLRGEPGPVEPRFAGWVSTWRLFLDHPLVGAGLGSFGRAIHTTQSVDAPEELWYAHSEPLNVLADTGVVGLALVATWIVTLALRGRAALRRAATGDALLAAGAAGGAAAALTAGLGDFPTQFAPVALPCAAFLALPAALASPAPLDAAGSRVPGRLVAGLLALAAVVPAATFVARAAHVAGGLAPGASAGERLLVRGRAELDGLRGAKSREEAMRKARAAVDLLAEAAAAEPALDAAHLWEGLAHVTLLQLASDPADVAAEREAALRAFGAARAVSRGHANVNLQIGVLYLDLLGSEPNPFGPAGDTATAALREAGAILPQAFSRAWQEALARELPPEELEKIVPDRPYARREWARHLRTLGRADEADAILNSLETGGAPRR